VPPDCAPASGSVCAVCFNHSCAAGFARKIIEENLRLLRGKHTTANECTKDTLTHTGT
jgi:hypothetical protein